MFKPLLFAGAVLLAGCSSIHKPDPPVRLTAETRTGSIEIQWKTNPRVLEGVQSAVLRIVDNTGEQRIPLTSARLTQGTVSYLRPNSDVRVDLEYKFADARRLRESISYLHGTTTAPPEPVVAPAAREPESTEADRAKPRPAYLLPRRDPRRIAAPRTVRSWHTLDGAGSKGGAVVQSPAFPRKSSSIGSDRIRVQPVKSSQGTMASYVSRLRVVPRLPLILGRQLTGAVQRQAARQVLEGGVDSPSPVGRLSVVPVAQ